MNVNANVTGTKTGPLMLSVTGKGMIVEAAASKQKVEEAFLSEDGLAGLGDAVEQVAHGLVADVSTKEGVSQVKAMARDIASVKVAVDNIGKAVVAELKEKPKLIDRHRAEFRSRMESLQDEIRQPVTEIEEREARITELSGTHMRLSSAPSSEIDKAIGAIHAIPDTAMEWHESLDGFRKAKTAELNALALLLDAARNREAEAAELEKLRKNQAAADLAIAEKKAREEAESREREEKARLETERKLLALKVAEMEKAKKEADIRAQDAERLRKEAEDRARAEVAAKATETVGADSVSKERQKEVNSRILMDVGLVLGAAINDEYPGLAKAVAVAIIRGKITNVEVNYSKEGRQ